MRTPADNPEDARAVLIAWARRSDANYSDWLRIRSRMRSRSFSATADRIVKTIFGNAVLKRLDEGDVLIVTRLDRLARSTRDLLNILDTVAKAGAGFRSLADAWADTTTAHGRLMLTVLGGLAEFERELIRARTGEGRKRAQARGVKFGRPPKLTD